MLTQEQIAAMSIFEIRDCLKELEECHGKVVGWLYPQILRDEIEQLQEALRLRIYPAPEGDARKEGDP